jgi:hypothetical protein
VVGNGAACEDGSFDFGFATIFNSTAWDEKIFNRGSSELDLISAVIL